ncbi:MAG: hypothetical protein MUD12_08465 [Spirochaetes bacterium]|jgi:hypothetical protein|nr:hypothetical protein [Spirochaetota bacterium]
MKFKYILIGLISFLLLISISQIFNIPPYADDIFLIYKSGYFNELDREFIIIKDSFVAVKTLGKPEYGWIFLDDMEKKHGMKLTVYNRDGYLITAPGKKNETADLMIKNILAIKGNDIHHDIGPMKYRAVMPVTGDSSCGFCHKNIEKKPVIGAIRIERNYDAHVYYSAERILIFIFTSIILLAGLFFIVHWEPAKNVKELFDKKR